MNWIFLGHPLRDVCDFFVPPPFDFEPFKPKLQGLHGVGLGHALQPGKVYRLVAHAHVLVQAALLGEIANARAPPPCSKAGLRVECEPASGSTMPMMLRISVDFPAPFGPSKPTMAPLGTPKETPSNTRCAPKDFSSCDMESAVVIDQLNMSLTRSKNPFSRGSGDGWKFGASLQLSKVERSSEVNSCGVHTLRFTNRSPRP